MIFTIIGIWLIQFPFAWIVSNMESMGYLGIWWSFPVSYVLPAIITFIWYKTGAWKNKRVIG
jgi:Na+-driven multidrug efflux pump